MNHAARAAVAFALLAGCTNPPPAAGPETVTTPPQPAATPEPARSGPAPSASAPVASAPPAEALPPPKPTTLSLARTGDAALDAQLAEADKAFEAGDLAAALAGYEAAKKAAPRRAGPIVGAARVKVTKASPALGFAAAEKNAEVIAAAKDLKRAADLEPGYGPAHVEHGRALLLLGSAAEAEAALRKGAKLVPEEAEAHSALGIALLATGKTEEALVELTKAKELDPGSAARRGNLGTVLFMRGRVRDAIKEYEVEARLAPDDARAHSDLGTALLAESDFTRAIPELRRAIELEPKRATFRSNLGYALQLQGRVADAIVEYREALRLDPKLASAWINLATALARDPKTRGEARQALKTAGGIDPTDPRVKANLEELDALEKQSGGGEPTPSSAPKPKR
ncbi:MAG: tetratricopeptide repeat protein [Labilithrix sp.]|nr:tetratricopeptide repeat protein [Labilithrix sp.]